MKFDIHDEGFVKGRNQEIGVRIERPYASNMRPISSKSSSNSVFFEKSKILRKDGVITGFF